MKKIYLLAFVTCVAFSTAKAQFAFPVEITTVSWGTTSVQMPPSPLRTQILFIGGHDTVAHTAINHPGGNFAPGFAKGKQWHDYIGFTQDTAAGTQDLGWLSINHETVFKDDRLGDGGGMTVFKVRRVSVPGPGADSIIVVPQNLSTQGFPNVSTRFFNVDFKNTVGETGMNCGGITSYNDGRIWTAEEWFRTSNNSIRTAQNANFSAAGPLPMLDTGVAASGNGVRDTANFTITGTPWANFNGQTIAKWRNFNWMVEINPRTGKAIRKQYNWGRSGWEGGIVANDNKTVYLGDDATPGLFVKFVATTAGDFTQGDLYFHKYNPNDPNGSNPDSHWRKITNTNLDTMLNFNDYAKQLGATAFDRVEWVTLDRSTGIIYFTETGNDNVNLTSFPNVTINPHMIQAYKTRYQERFGVAFPGNDAQVITNIKGTVDSLRFKDYYGRVLKYNPATGLVTTHIEGGPYRATSPAVASYPSKHLTNPDGLGYMTINGRHFLIINEDLNGRSFGRTPAEFQSSGNDFCEMFLLDLSIQNPTVNDLVRIGMTPFGAEITGAKASFDGKTIFFNSQHPSKNNPFPYNNSMTLAISGWDEAIALGLLDNKVEKGDVFNIWPNPVARELYLNKIQDVAIYDASGKRLEVFRNVERIDMSGYTTGIYYIRNAEGQTQKLVVE